MNKKKKVILTQKYISAAIKKLQDKFYLVIVEDSGKDLAEVLIENSDCEALISFLSDSINRDIIDLGKNLKIIANYAVGYNNIDYRYAIEKGIYVTHTPDILTHATADLTMALILSVSRRIVEADEFLRDGKFQGWGANLLLGKELNGATLGIIGMGRVGKATAIRAKGFGMKVIYYSIEREKGYEEEHGFQYLPFDEVVKESDILSLHLPYTKDVHHLFNKKVLDQMKKDAIFINVARGPLVDEDYLAEKLIKNELFGAGLDVYESEPEVNKKLLGLKNVVLAPHIGSATYTTRLGMAEMTIDNVDKVLSGLEPVNLIPEWTS